MRRSRDAGRHELATDSSQDSARRLKMKRHLGLIGFLGVVLLAGCGSAARPPELTPVAARWQQVPKDLAAPVVFTIPGMEQTRVASVPYKPGFAMDVYYPAKFAFGAKPLPVVIFSMGYSADFTRGWFGAELKDLGQYVSWGELVAASGMIGIAYQTDYPDDDLNAVLAFIREKGRTIGLDRSRIGIFACSGNALTGLAALADKTAEYRKAIACGVIYYPVISYFMNKGDQPMPAPFKRALRKDVPLLLVKIGDERPEWKEAVDTFLAGANGKGIPLEVVSYDKGVHGFDTDQATEESRQIVERTLAFFKRHLAN
jgi:dienelactone hydrolase